MSKSMGTAAGFHFYTLYQSCGRKFYFRNILGLRPRFTAVPLLNGTAFHLGKETFYATGLEAKALAAVKTFFLENKVEFERPEDYALVRARLPLALSAWISTFGKKDLRQYTFIALEKVLSIPFANGFVATVRPDAIVRDREDNIFILETKTTGFSADMTEISVAFGDQVTVQLAAARRTYPKFRVMGVVPDILFWLKSSRSSREIKCIRGSLITREDWQLDEWERSTASLLSEISQKAAAVERGFEPAIVFRRNTEFCVSYNHPCEFLHICRERDLPSVPHGFVLDESIIHPLRPRTHKGKKK
jgi:hypothetical protein